MGAAEKYKVLGLELNCRLRQRPTQDQSPNGDFQSVMDWGDNFFKAHFFQSRRRCRSIHMSEYRLLMTKVMRRWQHPE